jgi:hypothetical protein
LGFVLDDHLLGFDGENLSLNKSKTYNQSRAITTIEKKSAKVTIF